MFYGPNCCALRRGSTAPTSLLKHEWHVKYIIHMIKVTHICQQSKRVIKGGNMEKTGGKREAVFALAEESSQNQICIQNG